MVKMLKKEEKQVFINEALNNLEKFKTYFKDENYLKSFKENFKASLEYILKFNFGEKKDLYNFIKELTYSGVPSEVRLDENLLFSMYNIMNLKHNINIISNPINQNDVNDLRTLFFIHENFADLLKMIIINGVKINMALKNPSAKNLDVNILIFLYNLNIREYNYNRNKFLDKLSKNDKEHVKNMILPELPIEIKPLEKNIKESIIYSLNAYIENKLVIERIIQKINHITNNNEVETNNSIKA